MAEPLVFIVFGATGDLMHRKLMPALHDLLLSRQHHEYIIVGVARSKLSDEQFRDQARKAMVEHGLSEEKASSWCASRLYFQSIGDQTLEDFQILRKRIETLEEQHGMRSNRVLYLALPPSAFDDTLIKIGESGLAQNESGWTRAVIEKPFGRDLESSRALNALVHRYFNEDQIYRIDHYLGKETVQNLMVFRFGNAVFESLWNREHIERVDILVAEDLGVGSRAGYFDKTGTLRDMVQNHLTQLLTLIAMEVPATMEASAIRHEKVKVLQSIKSLDPGDVILGQYTRGVSNGSAIPGYREEDGVVSDSQTDTYAALQLQILNWRWQGVPFYLVTGKRMPRRLTRIAVTFRRPPITLFKAFAACCLTPNVLNITLQPDEGFSLSFDVKKPGQGFAVETQQLKFGYEEVFGKLPEAYHTLLDDIIRGDQTLFVHADEVEKAWQLYTPVLEQKPDVHFYAAGTWGPSEAKNLTGEISYLYQP